MGRFDQATPVWQFTFSVNWTDWVGLGRSSGRRGRGEGRQDGGQIGTLGLGQSEQAFQINRRPGPEPLKLPFGFTPIPGLAQTVPGQFGDLALYPAAQAVHFLEFGAFLALPGRL